MTNLTITIDPGVLRRARLRALAQGTSVNAVLRDYLMAYSAVDDGPGKAVRELLALADASRCGSGDRAWTRDDLHER